MRISLPGAPGGCAEPVGCLLACLLWSGGVIEWGWTGEWNVITLDIGLDFNREGDVMKEITRKKKRQKYREHEWVKKPPRFRGLCISPGLSVRPYSS